MGEPQAKLLRDAPNLEQLACLDLRGTGLGPRAAKWLRKRFGDRLVI
jgi:hypothetical protein